MLVDFTDNLVNASKNNGPGSKRLEVFPAGFIAFEEVRGGIEIFCLPSPPSSLPGVVQLLPGVGYRAYVIYPE